MIVFLGAVVGVERSVLPLLAGEAFGLASATATLSFLVAFGLSKSVCNFLAGRFADRLGRRTILRVGWLVGLAVPPLIIVAPSWAWVTVANLLLGANQGLVWSTAIIMKIDLAGPPRRGLATGVNEFAGYLAVAASALAAGYLADAYGIRPVPFLVAAAAVALGLLLSLLAVRDTGAHVDLEHAQAHAGEAAPTAVGGSHDFARLLSAAWATRGLLATNQAGFFNNLKEGVVWGLFPIYFAAEGLSLKEIGWIAATYPALWGCIQLGTGALSDHWGRRSLISGGLWFQAIALIGFATLNGFAAWMVAAVLLGVGTAAVYPTLIAQVGDLTPPRDRAAAIGVYRLWRDLGYVAGALLAGIVADLFGHPAAIVVVAVLLVASGVVARLLLPAPQGMLARAWAVEMGSSD